MNSLFLLISALVVFGFGYRFYSKLLTSAVFRSSSDYSIASENSVDDAKAPTNPYFLLGQHFGLVTTAATLSGATLAVYWGWIPAFLWVVVGSTLAAGIYSIGSLWLCRRHANESVIGIVRHYFPNEFVDTVLVLVLVVLMLLSALLLSITAALLVDYPSVVLPVVAFLLISVALNVFLLRRPAKIIAPATAAALVALLMLLWPLSKAVVGFSGEINLDVAGESLLTLNATLAWIVLLSVFLYYAQRPSLAPALGARAWLAACLFVVMLLILFVGIAIDQPQIIAPGFSTITNDVAVLPWLLVTITGGAIAGIYLLITNHYTAPHLTNEIDARVVGYGTVVLEGLAAVSAIIICTAGFASLTEWKVFYASWAGGLDPSYMLQLYINGFNYFASFAGLSPNFATHYAAMTLVALCLSTLEVVIGLLVSISAEAGDRLGLATKTSSRRRLVVILVIAMIIATINGASETPVIVMLYGMGNQLIAALGLLLIVMALKQRNLPAQLPLGLILLLLPVALWAIALQLGLWWTQSAWWLILPGLGIFAIGSWILLHTGHILWKMSRFGAKA